MMKTLSVVDSADSGCASKMASEPHSSLKALAAAWRTALERLLYGVETTAAARTDGTTTVGEVNVTHYQASSLALLRALYGSTWPHGLLRVSVDMRVRPCYVPVVAPLLVVLDLDHTLLRRRLSDCGPCSSWAHTDMRAVFVDADFLHRLCELLMLKGHHLAVASFTEGTYMSTDCGNSTRILTPAQAVVRLLDSTLPLTRTYLTHAHQVVCMPASGTSYKVPHLRRLQERLSSLADWTLTQQPTPFRTNPHTLCTSAESAEDGSVWTSLPAHPDHDDRDTHRGVGVDSPRIHNAADITWVSTEVVLIDDNITNCRSAAQHGYHAYCCGDGGLTFEWFAQCAALTQLLGLTHAEVALMRQTRAPTASTLEEPDDA